MSSLMVSVSTPNIKLVSFRPMTKSCRSYRKADAAETAIIVGAFMLNARQSTRTNTFAGAQKYLRQNRLRQNQKDSSSWHVGSRVSLD
jgi:hypothetical protein